MSRVAFNWPNVPYSRRIIRLQVLRNRTSVTGHSAVAFGVSVGYWPCLGAPFIELRVLFWRIDLWYGTPSYLYKEN